MRKFFATAIVAIALTISPLATGVAHAAPAPTSTGAVTIDGGFEWNT